MRSLSGLVAFALVALPCACGTPDARDSVPVVQLVDDAGRTITLAAPARRIVSLIPATTELLFAIGAGPAVVGRTNWCDYPEAALAVPSVGDGIGPNLELVIGRRPDLVLFYASADRRAAEHLARLGIPAMSLNTDQLADVPRLARLLGRVSGHERTADSVAAAFEHELAAAVAPEGAGMRTAFLLVWDQPPMTVGRGSFLTELMARAGLRNVFDDVQASSAVINIEGVVSRNPDVILTLGTASPKIAGRPEWEVVPAVRDRRFVHAEGSEFSHPGPRSPQAIRELRQAVAAAGSR